MIAIVFFTWLKGRLSVDNPGAAQQCMEALLTNPMGVGARDLLEDIAGHHALKYLPMIGGIGMFILMCNLISLVPGFSSPTAEKSVPLGCAIVVFLYYNWSGLVHHGPLKIREDISGSGFGDVSDHVCGGNFQPSRQATFPYRASLGEHARERTCCNVTFLGLTLSLFLFVGKLNGIGYALAPLPLLAPPLFMLLHIFVGFVQAFVFKHCCPSFMSEARSPKSTRSVCIHTA